MSVAWMVLEPPRLPRAGATPELVAQEEGTVPGASLAQAGPGGDKQWGLPCTFNLVSERLQAPV